MPRITKAMLVEENKKLQIDHAEVCENYRRLIEKMQELCDEFGCPPGLNRFDFLRHKLRENQKKRQNVIAELGME